MNKKYKILILEPSLLIASGMESMLANSLQFDVVGMIDSFDKIHEKIISLKPNILIINPLTIGHCKRYMVKSLFQSYNDLILIAMQTTYVEQGVLKQYHAVIEINDNQQKIESKLRESIHSIGDDTARDNHELSDREKDVLIAVAQGKMNKEIAEELHISIHTVISHRKNITRKTGIKSVSGLTVYALLNNLVSESLIQK
ncbi:MAG: response regulator transcription factor [Bacteroidales bacterium]|nr:response regulator transcription factor [Bacteroidales bacterium]